MTHDERLESYFRTRQKLNETHGKYLETSAKSEKSLYKSGHYTRSPRPIDPASLSDGIRMTQFATSRSAQLQQILVGIAEILGVQIDWAEHRLAGGIAWTTARRVFFPRVTDDDSFAVGLHELAHIATWREDFRDEKINDDETCRPAAEIAAWCWARAFMRDCPKIGGWTKAMDLRARVSLRSYLRHANDEERVSFGAEFGVVDHTLPWRGGSSPTVRSSQMEEQGTKNRTVKTVSKNPDGTFTVIEEREREPDDVIQVKTAPSYREVGADGVDVRARVKKASEIAVRARANGQRCERCAERLASTMKVDHVHDTVEFLCSNCDRSTVRSVARPATADPATLERYLALKGFCVNTN